jgi:hypothetical protein
MAINIRDIKNTSSQVSVEGEISLSPTEVEDVTDAMIVGPSETGPVFVPKEVRTQEEFEQIFGPPTTYSAYSALEVLKQTDRVNFTRVLSTAGWDPSPIVLRTSEGTDFPHFARSEEGNILGIFILDDKYKREENVVPEKTNIVKSTATTPKTARDFTLETYDENDNLVDRWRLSFNPFSGRYVTKILPPKVRVYQNFQESQRNALDTVSGDLNVELKVYGENEDQNPLQFDTFDAPRTPWITSQQNALGERHRLFRIWIRSDGEDQNRRFKLSVVRIGGGTTESGWPTFTLRLRDFDDTDLNQEIIEDFEDLSLNPQDQRYIGKIIGTEYERYNEEAGRIDDFGVFDQNSLNIRVELSGEISESNRNTVPFGFEGYKKTFTTSTQMPAYRTEQEFPGRLLDYLTTGSPQTEGRSETISENLHLGIEFRIQENENFFKGIPEGAEKADDGFRLDEYVSPDLSESSIDERKFSLGFQGGTDGQSIYKEKFTGEEIEPQNTFGLDLDGKLSGGQEAYRTVFELLREVEGGFKFNLLSTPELDLQNHNRTVREAERLARERGDVFYVFDGFGISTTPEEAAKTEFQLDSTYAATYFGWVQPTTSDFEFVPPSAVAPQTYAKNDSLSDPWFAPAGPERGVIPNVKELNTRLSRNELDRLYGNSINAIRVTQPEGILVLGNRCFTDDLTSPVSSIDVRRTLVTVVSRLRLVAEDYLFEQINQETGQNLRTNFNKTLSTIQSRGGLRDFEVEISTPQSRGRRDRNPNSIQTSVSVVPQPSSEYINVDFVIQEEGINVIT